MKKTSSLTITAVGVALSAVFSFASPAVAQVSPDPFSLFFVDLNTREATNLGIFSDPASPFPFSASGIINDSGQIVGTSYTDNPTPTNLPRIFFTGPNGVGRTDLGAGFGFGINNNGQIVGVSQEASGPGNFITGPQGMGMTSLGSLVPIAINNGGQVIGVSDGRAVITGPNGMGTTELETLEGGFSQASAVNDAGQVVGFSTVREGVTHAFITGNNGAGITDLGTLGGDISAAQGINAAGQVVGFSNLNQDEAHAFLTGPNGRGMTDLGTLGGNFSLAMDINDSGQVVGNSLTSQGISAFVTGPGGAGMVDLNSLVDVPGGYFLTNAYAINNSGQIVAVGVIDVIPEPEVYALMLAGLLLIVLMTQRKNQIV